MSTLIVGGWKVLNLHPLKKPKAASLRTAELRARRSSGARDGLDTSGSSELSASFDPHNMESHSGDIAVIEEVRLDNPKVSNDHRDLWQVDSSLLDSEFESQGPEAGNSNKNVTGCGPSDDSSSTGSE